MDSLSKRFSPHHPKRDSGENTPGRRRRKGRGGSEQLSIVPVPPEDLPEEMKSVLESVCADRHRYLLNSAHDTLIIIFGQFISPQRPSLADTQLAHPGVQHASTSGRTQSQSSSAQGYERYDYDGRNDYGIRGPNAKWPFTFSLKGKGIPSRVYHTHKVVPRSRPNAKEQLGKRKWHPSRRHGRVIRQEDYGTNELGQTTQFLNSESLLDLSVRGGRVAEGKDGRGVGDSRLWRWTRSGKSKLGKLTRKMLCRG